MEPSARVASLPRQFATPSMGSSNSSLHSSDDKPDSARPADATAAKRSKQGVNWMGLLRSLRPSHQQKVMTRNFQKRLHLSSDVVVAVLEALIFFGSMAQLHASYKAPFWRQNRACARLKNCIIDLPDGSFHDADVVRSVMVALAILRAWVRSRAILKSRKRDQRGGCKHKLKAEFSRMLWRVVLTVAFPFPGLESTLGRDRSDVFLLLTLAVGVRPTFWRQLMYFPYPIRQKEKVASFSGKLEFTYREFVLKKVLDDDPLKKIATVYMLLLTALSYLVHVVETMDGACRWPPGIIAAGGVLRSQDAKCVEVSASNAFWLVSTTLVPIGFGDLVPATNAGRVLIALAAVVAICLNSMFFSVIIRKFSFSTLESRVHAFLYRMDLYSKKDQSAVLAVQATFRFHKSYQRSLIWHQSGANVLYRPLSKRLPNEVKKKLYISHFQTNLKDIMRYDTDGDPINSFTKHVEVITAALGATFIDITRLKRIFARKSVASTAPSPRYSMTQQRSTPPSPRSSMVQQGSAPPSPRNSMLQQQSPRNSMLQQADGLSHAITPGQATASNSSGFAALASASGGEEAVTTRLPGSIGLNRANPRTEVPAAWGEEMLRKCEETMAMLRQIKRDAKLIL